MPHPRASYRGSLFFSNNPLGQITDWAKGRWLVLTVSSVACLPIVVAVAQATAAGWMPAYDDGVIATRAYDVFTERSPLVGQYSLVSGLLGEDVAVYSAGPLLYWLLAIPARIGPEALIITMALINILCVFGTVVLAHRRGGKGLVFAVALFIIVMSASLPTQSLYEIWNPSAAIFPFMLLIFVAWSIANCDYRLLPLSVLLFSFVAQCHLTYLIPALGLLTLGIVGVVSQYSSRIESRQGRDLPRYQKYKPLWTWSLASLLVALICWSAPLIDELRSSPGNLSNLVKVTTTDYETMGPDIGWRSLTKMVGIPPWWISKDASPFTDILTKPALFTTVTTVVAIALLMILATLAMYRNRFDITSANVVALILCIGVILTTSSSPVDNNLSLVNAYILRWSYPAGMFVWLVLGWSTLSLITPLTKRVYLRVLIPARAQPVTLATAFSILAVSATVVSANGTPPADRWNFKPLRKVSKQINEKMPHQKSVSLVLKGKNIWLLPSVTYILRRRGIQVTSISTVLSNRFIEALGLPTTTKVRASRCVLLFEDKPLPKLENGLMIGRFTRKEWRKTVANTGHIEIYLGPLDRCKN